MAINPRVPRSNLRQNEDGIVAITVTIIFIIVISLTAFGLARLARREQRQALDNRLASQALYTAEAGLNDAMTQTATTGKYATADKTSCNSDPNTGFKYPGFYFLSNDTTKNNYGANTSGFVRSELGDISAEGEYSCVLINHTLPSLEYSDVGQTKSVVSNLQIVNSSGPVNDFYLTIGWQDTGTVNTFANGPMTFPSASSWGQKTGILRADVTLSNQLDRASLDRSMTMFLYPQNGSSNPTNANFTSSVNQRANVVSTNCNTNVISATGKYCNVKLHVTGSNSVLLRMKSIYRDNRVTIVAQDASNNAVTIKGAQTLIDVTGKVQDVVKRIQIRSSNSPDVIYPEYAIESVDGICKLLQTEPGGTTYDPTPVSGSTRDKSVCDPAQR